MGIENPREVPRSNGQHLIDAGESVYTFTPIGIVPRRPT